MNRKWVESALVSPIELHRVLARGPSLCWRGPDGVECAGTLAGNVSGCGDGSQSLKPWSSRPGGLLQTHALPQPRQWHLSSWGPDDALAGACPVIFQSVQCRCRNTQHKGCCLQHPLHVLSVPAECPPECWVWWQSLLEQVPVEPYRWWGVGPPQTEREQLGGGGCWRGLCSLFVPQSICGWMSNITGIWPSLLNWPGT